MPCALVHLRRARESLQREGGNTRNTSACPFSGHIGLSLPVRPLQPTPVPSRDALARGPALGSHSSTATELPSVGTQHVSYASRSTDPRRGSAAHQGAPCALDPLDSTRKSFYLETIIWDTGDTLTGPERVPAYCTSFGIVSSTTRHAHSTCARACMHESNPEPRDTYYSRYCLSQ